jgi:hypothetical protein
VFLLGATLANLIAAPLHAQGAAPAAAPATAPPPKPWKGSAATSASFFFGASSQRLVATSASLARRDSLVELSATVQFRYGDAADADGARFVSARGWVGALSLDVEPHAWISPFISGRVETSLEKRIALRTSGGAGTKWVLARSPTSQVDVSLAALGERTRPTADSDSVISLLRWSSRLRWDRRLHERLRVSHTTFYQPAMSAPSQFTLQTITKASYAITDAAGITLSLTDSYDSEARTRGARSNNDGQVLAGVETRF